MPEKPPLKERAGYGWVIVVVFLLASLVIIGIRLSFGVFFKSIEAEFGLSRAATSAVFSTYMALGCVFALIGGWALDRWGPRRLLFLMGCFTGLALIISSRTEAHWQLFFTFSLPLAVGGGAIFTVSTSTLSRWFDKRRSLALGISLSGAGLGAVVVSPLAAYLIQSFDWRTAYLIIGVLAWVVVLPLSRLVVNRTGNTDAAPAGSAAAMVPDLPFSKLLRSRNFILLWLNFMLFGTCLFLVYTHLVPHATDTGISGEQAATIMSVLGFASVAGRILLGIVADRFGRKLMAVSCTVLQGVSLLFLIWADGLWAFYLFALVFGFGLGGVGPTTAALVGDTFGLRKIGVILGALDVGFGVGAALGPVAAGFIFDVSHSYAVAFITGTLAAFAGALVLWLVKKDIS